MIPHMHPMNTTIIITTTIQRLNHQPLHLTTLQKVRENPKLVMPREYGEAHLEWIFGALQIATTYLLIVLPHTAHVIENKWSHIFFIRILDYFFIFIVNFVKILKILLLCTAFDRGIYHALQCRMYVCILVV